MEQRAEVVVIGGGVGGASLAYRLALAGVDVLVLEMSREFRDRVRGDVMYPWGVTAARDLGVLDVMLQGPARRLPYWRTSFVGAPPPEPRELQAEVGESALTFFHPELQRALLDAAADAGARVVRGARATDLGRGAAGPRVGYRHRGERYSASAALVVGADGRNSAVGRWAGFQRRQDEPRLVFAGALLRGVTVPYTQRPADTNQLYFHPSLGLLAMLLPVDEGHTRVYAGYHLASGRRPEVGSDLDAFLALALEAGAPPEALADAVAAGPLAAFDGADSWVEVPYAAGVALIGDAAATSDPSFGSGMALTMLSAALLADELLAARDAAGRLAGPALERAGAAYASRFAAAYGSVHRQVDWLTDFYRTPGPEADTLRSRLYPLHAAEPSRVPDVVGLGPAGKSDERARRVFLGEDDPGVQPVGDVTQD